MSTDKTGISLVTDPGPPNKGHLVAAGGPRGLSGAGTTAGGVGSLDFYLLDGVGDSEITSDLNALSHLIKDHVESNYHLRPIQLNATSIMESLSGLGLNDHTQSQIATLALDTRTRHFAIRSLLVRVIFSALDIHSVGDLSLLPPSMAAFVQALPPTSSFKNSGLPTAKALDTWRRLSVYLLHEKREERTQLPPPAAIHSQIKSLLNALDRFLQHFVYDDNRARSDQARNLEGVISECIGVGYAVLSHPTEMRYTFHSRSNKSAVVVLPGIERLSSRNGEAYTTPQVVAWPETVNV
ncbi:hypothetical protein QBC35DRAFT_435964 [Podospora australis]|uniref:Uncharacterized protein n=1 Tax=Podospora australis TaxID=1536484 RepID=A0AAN7AHN7_9PEZI|nr:hypothetical protein QBC35DRAFT_435964 [Podospora australis]